jgi:hypothetical protein
LAPLDQAAIRFRNVLLASQWVVPADTEVQVYPAALPLHLIVILGPAERRGSEQRCCFEDSVCDVARQFLEGALPVWRAVTQIATDDTDAAAKEEE